MVTYKYGNSQVPIVLIQLVGEHELPEIENKIMEIQRITNIVDAREVKTE